MGIEEWPQSDRRFKKFIKNPKTKKDRSMRLLVESDSRVYELFIELLKSPTKHFARIDETQYRKIHWRLGCVLK